MSSWPACPTNGTPCLVLVRAGRLADAHEIRVRVALAGHRIRRGRVERAAACTARRRSAISSSDVELRGRIVEQRAARSADDEPGGHVLQRRVDARRRDCVDGTCTASRGGCGAGFGSARRGIGSARSTALRSGRTFGGAAGLADRLRASPRSPAARTRPARRRRRCRWRVARARRPCAPSSASASSTLIESSTSSASPSSRRCSR